MNINTQGQELRKIAVDTFILTITWIQSTNQELCLLAVSLANGQVHFYRQGILVEQLHFKTYIISMTFGRYGREDGTLVMVSKGLLLESIESINEFAEGSLTLYSNRW